MRSKRGWFAFPYVIWMALFVVVPIIIMAVYAFTAADPATGAAQATLGNFTGMGLYLSVFLRSFWLAVLATLVCLLIGYPVSYWMAKEGPRFQRLAMALIMLPMWMNFLLRTYSWMSILENNGLLNQLFRAAGLLDLLGVDHLQMIGTPGAVVLGMVYNYHLFRHRQAGQLPHRGRPGPGGGRGAGIPQGDLPPVPAGHPVRGDHGVCAVRVHVCHLQPSGGRQPDDAGRPHRAAIFGRGL